MNIEKINKLAQDLRGFHFHTIGAGLLAEKLHEAGYRLPGHTDKREAVDKIISTLTHKIDTTHYDYHYDYRLEAIDQILKLFPEPKLLGVGELIRLNEQWEEEYEDVEMTDAEWELKRWQLICQTQLKAMGE